MPRTKGRRLPGWTLPLVLWFYFGMLDLVVWAVMSLSEKPAPVVLPDTLVWAGRALELGGPPIGSSVAVLCAGTAAVLDARTTRIEVY